MKKKIILIFLIVFCLLLSSGCTLHFKASEMEIETKPPEGRIGNLNNTNHTYELSSVGVL